MDSISGLQIYTAELCPVSTQHSAPKLHPPACSSDLPGAAQQRCRDRPVLQFGGNGIGPPEGTQPFEQLPRLLNLSSGRKGLASNERRCPRLQFQTLLGELGCQPLRRPDKLGRWTPISEVS